MVFEEGLSVILASAAVDILMAFFFKVKFTFFPAGLAGSLLISFRYFQILNNHFG